MEFIPEAFWASHSESGQRKMEVAQKELRRLNPELFENVVFLEDYRNDKNLTDLPDTVA